MKRVIRYFAPALLAGLAFTTSASEAAVQVLTGPTPIVNGNAKARGDITVTNEKLAFALAVESPVPYGVPRGAIVDVAPVRDGQIGQDHVVFADFIPNNWSAWPNTYHRVTVLERGPDRAVIQAVRDWGKVAITTTYTLASGSDHIEIQTVMRNDADTALPDLLSGLTLWPQGGYVFAVPGLAGSTEPAAGAALSDRVSAYDVDWAITLHAPYFDHVGDGSRDMYFLHTLAAGASRIFDGWLQVGARGDLAPVVHAEIERRHLASGNVLGVVTDRDGHAVDEPLVVVKKDDKPYAWALGDHDGHYTLSLPTGDYAIYATGRNSSESAPAPLKIETHGETSLDFHDLEKAGQVQLRVKDSHGAPLDARIAIKEGQRPLVQYLGRRIFFTELEPKGRVALPLAPGKYILTVSSGGGFLSAPQDVSVTVDSDATKSIDVELSQEFNPRTARWFAADLHHHADQAEAVTPPPDVARSQLAAGLDLLFASDHDSTVNHTALQRIALQRDIPFIPSVELSPSWGHFNAFPLTPAQHLAIDPSTSSVSAIFKEAHRLGASVIQVNHPFIPYGYFSSVKAHVAPGGFNPAFELVEINATVPDDDAKVLEWLWKHWNAGQHYYLSGGTDTHDVWSGESGRVRTFAHVDGKLTPQAFARALREGHGYVSRGPLVFPSFLFGATVVGMSGEPLELGFELGSIAGLRRAELIGAGKVVQTRDFPRGSVRVRVEFEVPPPVARWYQLIVEDNEGGKAYTDPIWIETHE